MTSKAVSLIPYVCGAGAQVLGCEQAPSFCKQKGLDKALGASWFVDPDAIYQTAHGQHAHQNVPPLGSEQRHELVYWHCQNLRDSVRAAVEEGTLPVVIGGDHSMAAASMAGLVQAREAHGRIGLVWIDAHPDLNTWETTPSQSIHGMPVAAILGMGDKDMQGLADTVPMVKHEHVFYLGIRDIDPGEHEAIAKHKIWNYSMKDINTIGLDNAVMNAFEHLSGQVDHLVLSIDLDGIDPQDTPAVGSPVPGGIRLKDLLPVLKKAAQTHELALIEIAEFNPTLENADQTYEALTEILRNLLQK